MLIDACIDYKKDLFSLWKEAFGDEDGYIELFFETVYKENITVFAEFDCGKAVSALYLMRSYIKSESRVLDGYYLYAAATLKAYRGKGLMGKLINEAKAYVSDKGKDFISLVPGEESLCAYYNRFGFEPLMYRCKDTLCSFGNSDMTVKGRRVDEDYFEKRVQKIEVSAHHLYPEAYRYALSCFNYLSVKAYSEDDFSVLYDNKNKQIIELISTGKYSYDKLLSVIPEGEYTVYSPKGKNKEKFGMVWFSDNKNCVKDIYMNIALDQEIKL